MVTLQDESVAHNYFRRPRGVVRNIVSSAIRLPSAVATAVGSATLAELPAAAPEETLEDKLKSAEKTAATHATAVANQQNELIQLFSHRGRILALLDDLGRRVDRDQRKSILATLKEHKGALDTAVNANVKLGNIKKDYETIGRIAARGRQAASTDPAAAQAELDKCEIVFTETEQRHYRLLQDNAPAVKELVDAEPALIKIEEALRKLKK